jgi:putative nucleotidyltransferase with HDIG domain
VPLGVAPTRQQLRSWRGHPLAATAIRLVAFATPIVAALAWSAALSRLVAPPHPLLARGVWWIAMLASSTAVLFATERVARRMLPLAALLKLSLVFPDHVPSRFSVALRTGTTRQLARQLQQTRLEPTTRAGATDLLALVAALNHHDPLTRGHSERVRALSDLLAEQLQLDADDREKVRWAALLHDIGKLRVPGEILRKPGKPTVDEWEVLKTHPAEGLVLIRGPIADWLGDWSRAIGDHHEQFNGSGYPAGLSGTDISFSGRLVAVADVFDVITATRSYKKAMTIQEARLEITRCAGSQFDPDMVRAFLQISIGDLRKAMGPLSWLAQLSLFGRLAAAPAASTVAGTMIAVTGLGLAPATSVYSERGNAPRVAQHTVVETPAEVTTTLDEPFSTVVVSPRPSAATDTSLPDGPVPSDGSEETASTVPTVTTQAGMTPPNTTTPNTTTPPTGTTTPTNPKITVPPVPGAPTTIPATIPASIPATTVPATSVPVISIPPITLPVLTVPPIIIPIVTIPITIPPVSVPPITVPPITLPPVTLPPVTLPRLGI